MAWRRSISSAKRPARSIASLSTSSSGSTRSKSRRSSSVIATPSSRRSRPARHVPPGSCASLNGARWAASSPQRMPLARTHSSIRPRSSSSKPKRRRTGSRSARSSTCEAVRRSSASSSRRATTPSTGLVWRSERSASRTRRSDSSPVPKVAWISGANVSMSGHITITSRGSSVGSSASSCRIAARSTSTWRARPWQEWIWTLRSIGSVRGASSSRTPACRRCSSESPVVAVGWWWSVKSSSTSWSSRLSWPHEASSRLAGGSRSRPSAASGLRGSRPSPTAPATGAARRGGRRGRRPALRVPRRGRAEPGQPEQAEARRQIGELGLIAQARARAREALGGVGLGDAGAQPAEQLGLPGGVVRDAGVVARRPRADHLRPVQRVAVEEVGDVAHGREAARRVAAEVGGEALQPQLGERLVDDLEQRPDRALGQPRVLLDADRRRDRLGDQPARRREVDVRADAVAAAGPAPRARTTSAA